MWLCVHRFGMGLYMDSLPQLSRVNKGKECVEPRTNTVYKVTWHTRDKTLNKYISIMMYWGG